nr:MAG TPA: hypothetical protein [Caudoviricetes sp.]
MLNKKLIFLFVMLYNVHVKGIYINSKKGKRHETRRDY